MPRPRPDFVNIRLSEAGLKMAGAAGTVGWANARRHFHFVAGEAQPIMEEVLADDAAALPEPLRTLVDQEPGEGD